MPLLICHPATQTLIVERVTAEARWLPEGRLGFYFVIEGDTTAIRLPAQRQSDRADELWRHTCCEAFVAGPDAGGYSEFNFSPSGAWAAYRFTGYRKGMKPVAVVADPVIEVRHGPGRIELDALIGSRSIPLGETGLKLGLAVVIEEVTGHLSYWALAHPAGKPDFHHAASFPYSLAPAA